MKKLLFPLLLFSMCCTTCKVDVPAVPYHTKHVVIIVVDGARYSETWGDSTRHYIPFRAQTLLPQGVMVSSFFNNGFTWTSAGHDAICTGNYEALDNGGNALPAQPSFFQYWRKATGKSAEKAWIITSKDKLYVLSNTQNSDFQTKWMPDYDCGLNGAFTGYRDDSVTYHHLISKFRQYQPDLVLVNFREPDYSGHTGVWANYLAGIVSTDKYIDSIWTYLQNDPYYAGTTTLMVTNDHGRHLDNVADGFVSHGDYCFGCRHIEFIAAGPDFKRNAVLNINYEQIDIPATVSALLRFPMESGKGKVMKELFK